MSKQCPVCNTEYPDATTFCPSDGTPLSGSNGDDRFIGKILEGKYLIESKIGSGGMGNVYRGRHTQMETNVAIKILHASLVSDATAVERFRREARAALTVNHPNIIQVMDFGVSEDQTVFIVMELLDGLSLQKILETEGIIPVDKTVRIFRQVCAAVGTAHSKNVIHRDLKPDNIIILNYGTPAEQVKVLDFSIAKVMSKENNNKGNLTEVGLVVGTPQYISPEQAQGLKLDTRADIYSLGVTLYQMFTGILPFTAASSMALALKHIHALPRPLREVNPQLSGAIESVVMKAMAKRPDDRQQTAFELGDELEAAAVQPVSGKMIQAPAPVSEPVTTAARGGSVLTSSQPASVTTNPTMTPPRNAQNRSQPSGSMPTPQPTSYDYDTQAEAPKKRGMALGLIAVLILLIGGGAGTYFYLKGTGEGPPKVTINPYLQNMVWIEGADYKMGSDAGKNVSLDETPSHNVSVGDFWIGAYEVTNDEYKKFIDEEKYAAPEGWQGNNYAPGAKDLPVTNVTWNDAAAYCKYLSKKSKLTFRLPTEAEWEYAAKGTDDRIYPWGKVWATNKTVSGESDVHGEAVSVNSSALASDQSPFRIFGMAGNVTEWTTTDYRVYPNSKAEQDTKCNSCKILRGGNYSSPNKSITTTHRAWNEPDFKEPRIGFRVAADATPEDRKQFKKELTINAP